MFKVCWARVRVSVSQRIGEGSDRKHCCLEAYGGNSDCGKGELVCGPQARRQIWPSLREVLAQMEEPLRVKALLELLCGACDCA